MCGRPFSYVIMFVCTALHPSNYYTHKTYTYSHTHHVACYCPNVNSNGSSNPSGHLPLPSRGQKPSFRTSEPNPQCLCPPSPANPHAPNHSPSLMSAAPSSTQLHHSCLPESSSALSSPFTTLPALQHVSNLPLAPRCILSLPFTATLHLLVSPSILTTATLPRLAGFLQSFTSHSPVRSQRRMLLTDIKYIPLFRSTVLVLNIYVHLC
jgi:hypothetical protein